jgi:hypothetical protein
MSVVLQKYPYILLALVVGFVVFAFAVLLPNLTLIRLVWLSDTASLGDKLILPLTLLTSITTNFTALSAITTTATSLLIGVNVALIVYLYRRQKAMLSGGGIAISGIGVFLGMFGVGCAACGSLILTALLSTVGGIGILSILPFQGQELGIVGVLALLYATYFLLRRIIQPITCDI